MSIVAVFKTTKLAKDAGWFSRRHQSSEKHLAAKNKRALKKSNKTDSK